MFLGNMYSHHMNNRNNPKSLYFWPYPSDESKNKGIELAPIIPQRLQNREESVMLADFNEGKTEPVLEVDFLGKAESSPPALKLPEH